MIDLGWTPHGKTRSPAAAPDTQQIERFARNGCLLANSSWRAAASIVRLPIDPDTFQPIGPPTRWSGTSRVESMPDLSPEGRRVA